MYLFCYGQIVSRNNQCSKRKNEIFLKKTYQNGRLIDFLIIFAVSKHRKKLNKLNIKGYDTEKIQI